MNATTTTRECAAAAAGVDEKNQYTLYPPLLPSWSRLRKLFGRGSDLSVLRALEYELMGQIRFSGRILDFGGGSNANYRELLRQWMAGCTYETANIDGDIGPTHLIRPGQPLPIAAVLAATLLVPETNVGGYENTGWDLVANMVGAFTAAAGIWLWSRRPAGQ